MVNLVFYGEGKEGKTRKLRTQFAKYLPKDWNACLVTTLKETVELVKDERVKFYYMYSDEVFGRKLTAKEIEDVEQWLGFPLRMFKQYDRGIKDNTNKRNDVEILNFIAKVVIFWRNFFEQNQTDVLMGGYPSSVPYTTAEHVAERLGIKVIKYILDFGQKHFIMSNRNYELIEWNRENYDGSEIDETYRNAREEFYSRKKPLQASTIDAFRWNLSIINPKVFFLKAKQLLQTIDYNRAHKHELYLESAYWQTMEYIKSVVRARMIPQLYQPIKKGEKYFFFPYHYVMDAQMLYREPYVDQAQLVENIAHCLPYDTYLYTRPHPGYYGSDLPFSVVKKVLKLPNVKLISTKLLPREIIENSVGIFTINSTTGYEAIFLNKPVITFGHELYSRKGVTLVVRDFHELPGIIFKVMNDPLFGVDIEKRKEFIYKIWKNGIPIEGGKAPTREFYAIWKHTENDFKRLAEAFVKAYENYDRVM